MSKLDPEHLLASADMARFVARGFLARKAVVPDAINRAFLEEADADALPLVPAGTPLAEAYPAGSALARLVEVPAVRGLIESLVGPGSVFDHHFLHRAMPRSFFEERGLRQISQPTHQDSTIDVRMDFDVQLFYFPHDCTREMGGTRFLPGSHFRRVSESAVARYQNFKGQEHAECPAGSVFVFHHGLWHGGGVNTTDRVRTMFKIRLQPTVPQVRLWNTDDLPADHDRQRPIFFVRELPDPDHLHSILCSAEPWFELDASRLEFMNRIRLWRFVLGDESFDADYWLTRIENAPSIYSRSSRLS